MEWQTRIYSKGVPLKASIVVPGNGDDPSSPVVILCHGHSRHMDDGLDVLARQLEYAGIASIRFDFSGCDSSSPTRYHLYCRTQWLDDLISVIDYAQKLPGIDACKLGIAGISMGGSTVVSVSALDPRVTCAVAMAPIDDCYSWLKGVWDKNHGCWEDFEHLVAKDASECAWHGSSRLIETLEMYHESDHNRELHRLECLHDPEMNQFVTMDSIKDLLGYRPIDYCPRIHIPVFFINGDKDMLVPAECSKRMALALGSDIKQHILYPGVDHNIPIDPQRDRVFEDIVAWFERFLKD